MEKKRSRGVTILAVLLILGCLSQLSISYASYKWLFQPLPQRIILAHYYLMKIILILGITCAVGIFYLKDIFRKIAIYLSLFTLFSYLIEFPVFILRNVPAYIEEQIYNAFMQGYFTPPVRVLIWGLFIAGWVIDICFALFWIYFFTRPRVKEQFK